MKPQTADEAAEGGVEPDIETLITRISRVHWAGERIELQYRGHQAVKEEEIGPIDASPSGLAFHPDGRIAFSEGFGTHPDMRIAFWDQGKIGASVVPLKRGSPTTDTTLPPVETRKRYVQEQAQMEREGKFWFFGGPLAFDRAGTCYFSLGGCGGNGLYRVESASPVHIERRYSIQSNRSLQIPFFDEDHFYVSMHDQVCAILSSRPKPRNPMLGLSSRGLASGSITP